MRASNPKGVSIFRRLMCRKHRTPIRVLPILVWPNVSLIRFCQNGMAGRSVCSVFSRVFTVCRAVSFSPYEGYLKSVSSTTYFFEEHLFRSFEHISRDDISRQRPIYSSGSVTRKVCKISFFFCIGQFMHLSRGVTSVMLFCFSVVGRVISGREDITEPVYASTLLSRNCKGF